MEERNTTSRDIAKKGNSQIQVELMQLYGQLGKIENSQARKARLEAYEKSGPQVQREPTPAQPQHPIAGQRFDGLPDPENSQPNLNVDTQEASNENALELAMKYGQELTQKLTYEQRLTLENRQRHEKNYEPSTPKPTVPGTA